MKYAQASGPRHLPVNSPVTSSALPPDQFQLAFGSTLKRCSMRKTRHFGGLGCACLIALELGGIGIPGNRLDASLDHPPNSIVTTDL